MADNGPQGQSQSKVEKVPEKQGLFSKVKDGLNFTKHLGFVSDLDSPANQAALAAMREKEETDGVSEDIPQAPLSDRVKQGVGSLAKTAAGVSSVAAGGVAPQNEKPKEQDETHMEKAQLGGTLDSPDVNKAGAAKEKVSEGSSKNSDHKSWGHLGGHKEKDPQVGKDEHSFAHWAARTAKKVGNAVASKDLSDDLLSKKPKS